MNSDSEQAGPELNAGDDFSVVGIGASAGGVAPLRDFFARVPADTGLAYVVILHLSPDHESSLPSLIQSQTPVPVTQVTESVRVEPNHIYVIPPSKYLMLMDGSIRLTEPERSRGGHTSIDLFFRTLADAYGKHAVAVVLSGTGADGSLGLGRIKEEGGFAIAQDPSEAEYPDMPRNAIDSGRIDLVLRVAEMPAKILALRDGARRLQLPEEEETASGQLDDEALRDILILMRLRTGNDFTHYKRPTLLRRIARRMQVREQPEMREYAALLRENPEEITALLRDLLITVTNFFRDREAFEQLEREVIPRLFAGKGPQDQVRIWSAGCATGEEAYSLAMLLAEYASSLTNPPTIQVFASDIDERAIAGARECSYPGTISLDVSPDRLRRFFVRDGERYQVRRELRELVLFAVHNVVRDPPFSKLDLISCRNLLIYLNRPMQDRILELFHFALRPDGYIFLGSAESAENVGQLFAAIDKKRRIYSRRRAVASHSPAPTLMTAPWQVKIPDQSGQGNSDAVSAGQLHQEVIEQLGPPSVLINEDYDILHSSANAGRFLRVPAGEPSRNLLRVIEPALRLDLRAALLEARTRAPGALPGPRRLSFDSDGQKRFVNLTVRPVGPTSKLAAGCFLILFDENAGPNEVLTDHGQADSEGLEVVHQLEHELQRTKDQLRITVEQYETSTEELRASNEELQAINEELRSATEELETSKEELQSVNEELVTVNQEYKEKIDEFARVNSDLQNLMASTDIGTIFLNRALQIKRYTTRAQELFNITPADIGRPLEHFSHQLDYSTLVKDAETVLRELRSLEREFKSEDGSWYLLRIAPYRTIDDRIDGVVLTFVDLTIRREAEKRLQLQADMLEEQAAIVNLAHVMVLDSEWRVLVWSSGSERLYGYTRAEAVGKISYELLHSEFSESHRAVVGQLERTGEWQGEVTQTTRHGERLITAVHLIRYQRETAGGAVILEVANDITARRQAEEALREADRKKDEFLATLAHELRNPLGAMLSALALLRTQVAKPDSVQTARGILERQLERLSRLVEDLLDSERLTKGQITIVRRPIALSEIFDAALETCRGLIEGANRPIQVESPPVPLFVDGDLLRLSQIVANLLHNALKYTPPNGKIVLSGERDRESLVIRVRDNGIGIAAERLSNIFEMYSYEDTAADADRRGLGIGLALVKQLTGMHGGTVEAHSAGLGRGSEFVVRLPLAPAPVESVAIADQSRSANHRTSKRVLVVEDNHDLADATALVLQAAGHQVKAVNDPREALAAAEAFNPEVAILDIGLPGIDGYSLARQLGAQMPALVRIALSGWRQADNDPRAAEAGFRHYLIKPFDPEKLAQMIAEIKPAAIEPQ